jgi:hypothetical protein
VKLDDFVRLKKLMSMTSSDSDAEALGAIRAANRILTTHGYTWEMVLSRTVTVLSAVEAMPADEDDAPPFDMALRGAAGTFRNTLLSIQAQYEERGFISARQRQVIDEAAERSVERMPVGRIRK